MNTHQPMNISREKRFGLPPDQIEFYRENGYLLAAGVFNREEAAYFREQAHDLARRLAETRKEPVVGSGWPSAGKVTNLPRELLGCHNVQFHCAAFARLIVDPRLTDCVADLIGPNVQLHHTKGMMLRGIDPEADADLNVPSESRHARQMQTAVVTQETRK